MIAPICVSCGKEMALRVMDMPSDPSRKSKWWECPSCGYSPKCPECDSTMLLRRTTRGPHIGSYFWGCSTFPECREIVDYDPPKEFDPWEKKMPEIDMKKLLTRMRDEFDQPENWDTLKWRDVLVLDSSHMTQFARQLFHSHQIQYKDLDLRDHFAVDTAVLQQSAKIIFDPFPNSERILVLKDDYSGNVGLQYRDKQTMNFKKKMPRAAQEMAPKMEHACYGSHMPDAQKCIICSRELDCVDESARRDKVDRTYPCEVSGCRNRLDIDDAVVNITALTRHCLCDDHLRTRENCGYHYVRERHLPEDIRGTCSQCGRYYEAEPCGPTHATIRARRADYIKRYSVEWSDKMVKCGAEPGRVEQPEGSPMVGKRPAVPAPIQSCATDVMASRYVNERGEPSHFPLPDGFHPKYCKRCGSSAGCMCPRDGEDQAPPPCEHRYLIRVNDAIAEEAGYHIHRTRHEEEQLYACKECHRVFTIRSLSKRVKK